MNHPLTLTLLSKIVGRIRHYFVISSMATYFLEKGVVQYTHPNMVSCALFVSFPICGFLEEEERFQVYHSETLINNFAKQTIVLLVTGNNYCRFNQQSVFLLFGEA